MNQSLWNIIAGIKNGYLAKRLKINQPKNKLSVKLLKVLYNEGFIKNYRIAPLNSNEFEVFLRYVGGVPIIQNIDLFAQLNKNSYISARDLWKLDDGITIYIMSITNKKKAGFLTHKECKKLHIGGKILCKIK